MKCNICGGEMPEGQSTCKYCGNIMAIKEKQEEKVPPIRRHIEMPPKHTQTIPVNERPYQSKRPQEGFCSKCGRPLDGITQKCIVCDAAQVSKRAYTNEDYRKREIELMAQKKKKKKKKNTALKIFISILLMIILFSAAVYGAIKLAGVLGIGGAQEEDTQVVTVTDKPRNTADPNWKAEVDEEETPEPTEEPTKAPVRTPEPVETGDPVDVRGGEYLYPSDTHLISEGELEELSRLEIKRIYWEVYARHGYTFDDDLADYFENNHKWYMPITSDKAKVEAQFNSIEKRNIKTIFDYQKKMGWR